jgi:REP element-mobilizing transposase RayT
MARGIEKREIFSDDQDRREFLRRLGAIAVATSTEIYAFVLMANHIHLLIKSPMTGLSTFMRRLLSGYAQYYNKRHERVGHLFQDRYKSRVCEELLYFRKLVAYIHLNPLRGGLVSSIEQLAYFPWCSQGLLLGRMSNSWYEVDYVLAVFGEDAESARLNYLAYQSNEAGIDRCKELESGGRSWSKVASNRHAITPEATDARILGSGKFVRKMLDEAAGRSGMSLPLEERLALARRDIETACSECGVDAGQLCSGARYRNLAELRRRLMVVLVEVRGLSYAETARQLGLTTSAVSQAFRCAGR